MLIFKEYHAAVKKRRRQSEPSVELIRSALMAEGVSGEPSKNFMLSTDSDTHKHQGRLARYSLTFVDRRGHIVHSTALMERPAYRPPLTAYGS